MLRVTAQLCAASSLAETFFGTPLYLSPELCQALPYSAATDVWSLGVLLHELAALRPVRSAPHHAALSCEHHTNVMVLATAL